MESSVIISFAVGLLAVLLFGQLIGLGIALILKFVTNSIIGAVILIAVNLVGGMFGFSLKITILKALIAGVFGIPGVIGIIIWDKFL